MVLGIKMIVLQIKDLLRFNSDDYFRRLLIFSYFFFEYDIRIYIIMYLNIKFPLGEKYI